MCDTAGTLTAAATLFMQKGAKSVRAFCTHPILSGPAYERIENSDLTALYVTDTIPLKKSSPKIHVLPVDVLFADVIKSLINNQSISKHFVIS
jgi:ribose-phosphate pyrophosphokinase